MSAMWFGYMNFFDRSPGLSNSTGTDSAPIESSGTVSLAVYFFGGLSIGFENGVYRNGFGPVRESFCLSIYLRLTGLEQQPNTLPP